MQPFSYHLRATDEAKLREISNRDPEIVKPLREMDFSDETNQKIGINFKSQVAGKAHIKAFFEDFIVEEITETNEICTIAPPDHYKPFPYNPETQKVEATITKKGMNGFELAERLAESLTIPLKYITFGGLKDGRGITAQRYCFNTIPPERLAAVAIPNTNIKDIHARTGMRSIGDLRGNRFTITLRTHPELNPYAFHAQLQHTEKHGFYNFFSLQRFGTRLQSHHLGKLILQQQYDEALKLFLIGSTDFETQLLSSYRKTAASAWGDWQSMITTFSVFPYFFQHELAVLRTLLHSSDDAAEALSSIPQQVKMWVAAYESYAFNLLLSFYAKNSEVHEKVPLLHPDLIIRNLYANVLDTDLLATFHWYHPKLIFLGGAKRREVATKSFPIIHACEKITEGYLLRFELAKGVYATNFLTNLVSLSQGRFTPSWVHATKVDGTAILDNYPIEMVNAALTPKEETEEILDEVQ